MLKVEAIKVLLFLFVGLGISILMHWLIGRLRSSVRHQIAQVHRKKRTALDPRLETLLTEWIIRGLRTLVWILYFIYVSYLLPQTRAEIGTVGERLLRVRDHLLGWLLERGITVVIIAVVVMFLARFIGALIDTGFDLIVRRTAQQGDIAVKRRFETISDIFRRTAQVIILFIGVLEILPQLDLNIAPILASAGVVGLAIGFGAQSLIKDIFSGLLILLEDQYSVGDTIKVGETTGTVEHLTLRATHVRNLDGALTIIPNGVIATVSNLSKGWSRVVLDIEIGYQEDMERAMEVMLEEARALRQEQPYDVIGDPVMLGVDRMTSTSIVLRLLLKTVPPKQADIGRELRRRIKLAFDRAKVRTPRH